VEVKPGDVPEVTRLVFRDLGARFQIASGVDTPQAIEILYHWAFDPLGFVVTVRTRLDRQNPEIESLARICKGTEWIEREMWELLGVRFRNHPDLRHLLLADDWPEGKYPLRRDYVKDAK
jgi:NADH:ubiquinone oxidoreductase subunit C